MKRMKNFRLSKPVALLGLVIGLAGTSCSDKGQQQAQQIAPSIAVMTISKTDAELETSYPAIIKGKKDVAIRPQVSGFITQVCVEEGQHVSAGQTLFIIDQVQMEAAVAQAEAAVAVARESCNSATITAKNKEKLFAKNIISEYENQLAQNSLASAKSQLAQAQAALVSAKKNLSYTVVKSPSAGYVGAIPNREGSLASPSSATPLTTVSDISEVYAYISFNEKQVLEMTEGGKMTLAQAVASLPSVKLRLADGTEYQNEGKVSTVTGNIDNLTGSASVRVLFKNENGMLRSGSTGSVVFPVSKKSVILIPQNATTEIQDVKYAYVVNDSNKIVSKPIQILSNNDGKNYVVTSGLVPGDRVAVEGVGIIVRDGVVINPVDAAAKAAQAQQK